jgi:hypothetical protein
MKKTFLFLTLLVSLISFSQEKTTNEEYNYLTEGYKISLETGADFKKGYELQKFEEDSYYAYKITYYLFIHSESKKTKAILITIVKDKDKKDKEEFLCLPMNNQELFKKFTDKTDNLGLNMKHYFNYSICKILSKSIEKINNK